MSFRLRPLVIVLTFPLFLILLILFIFIIGLWSGLELLVDALNTLFERRNHE